MKAKFLLLLSVVTGLQVFATHTRSGEIRHKYLGNYTFEVTVVLYAKYDGTSASADRDSVQVDWGDGSYSTALRSNGTDMTPANGIPDGEIIAVSPISIKKNEYSAVHTYSGAQSVYVVGSFDMNRIDGINNIDNGNSVNLPLYIQDSIFMDNTVIAGYNTSPVFLQHPVQYVFNGQPFKFNSTAYDADGDSLFFEPMIPLQDKDMNVPLYQYPNQYCAGNGIYNVDPYSGQISWFKPCTPGIFNVAVKVKEYRCGQLLSITMRDMQIIVNSFSNQMPLITTAAQDTVIQPGQAIQFSVSAADSNSTQTVSLVAYGGAFDSSATQPLFTATPGNPATGTFSWQPNGSFGKKHAYIFSIVATDNFQVNGDTIWGTSVASFRVWVADTSQCLIASNAYLEKENSVSVYPNPAGSFVLVSAAEEMKEVVVFDVTGQMVGNYFPKARQLNMPVNHLTQGVYIVTLHFATHAETRRFVKSD